MDSSANHGVIMEANWDAGTNPIDDVAKLSARMLNNLGIDSIQPTIIVQDKYVDIMQRIAGDAAKVMGIPQSIVHSDGECNYSSASLDAGCVKSEIPKPT